MEKKTLKLSKCFFQKSGFTHLNESPLKMMKNAFKFILEALFVNILYFDLI